MSNMYDNITGRAPIATDDLGYIGTGNKASDILNGGGTTDYNELTNKPTINNVELKGNKTSSDLGLQPTIDSTHKLSPDNISFTETQSNAINSGITAALTEQISTNQNNISLLDSVCGDLIDVSGIKNICVDNTISGTMWVEPALDAEYPAGDYIIYIGTNTTQGETTTCQIVALANDKTTAVSPYLQIAKTNGAYIQLTTTAAAKYIRVYAASSGGASSGKTISLTDVMVCKKLYWDLSHKYVPHS